MLNGEKEFGILIKASGEIEVVEIQEPLYASVSEYINGRMEHIRLDPEIFGDYCLVCDEEFLLKEKRPEFNVLATVFNNSQPLLGDVMFLREAIRNEEPDIIGLTFREAKTISSVMRDELEAIQNSVMYKEFIKNFNVEDLKPEIKAYPMEFDEEGNMILGEEIKIV